MMASSPSTKPSRPDSEPLKTSLKFWKIRSRWSRGTASFKIYGKF